MSESLASLQLMCTKGLGTISLRRLLSKLAVEQRPIADFVAASQHDNISYYGIKPEIVRGIESTYDEAKALHEKLETQGVTIHSIGASTYPAFLAKVLGDTAPPLLFSLGNMNILKRQGVGFCGARNASEKGLKLASESAQMLAETGVNVVSGYANGVDSAAHHSALYHGGVTTFVLAEGILRFRKKLEIASLLEDGRYLVLSEFPPMLGWLARNAMQRNRTIVGLSDAVIVIESGVTGGTFAAGETALQLHRPLFVVEYAHPEPSAEGNQILIERGAKALRGDREGKPNFSLLFQTLEEIISQPDRSAAKIRDLGYEDMPLPLPFRDIAVPLAMDVHMTHAVPGPYSENIKETLDPPLMATPTTYRKKLIEVSLPLEKINVASAREKSIRHGHPSTLHLWWARRPLATCRAVLFASLVDDPSALPALFPTPEAQHTERERLYRIIEELVLWENSNNPDVLLRTQREIARSTARTQGVELAEASLADKASVAKALELYAPPILDPFAGGGSIPLEAQRLGLKAYASDLNPVAVLINKAMIEIPPQFAGQPPIHPEEQGTGAPRRLKGTQHGDWSGARGLAEDVRYYGKWMRDRAFERIGHLYPTVTLPKEQGGGEATVIAWLWARTVRCPNPACGAQMPLVHSFILSTKAGREVFAEPQIDRTTTPPTITFIICEGKNAPEGTVNRKGACCVACDMSVEFDHVRAEGKAGRMSAQMMVIVAEGKKGRVYLAPEPEHGELAKTAQPNWIPDTILPHNPRDFKTPNYGMKTFGDLFTPRQLVALNTFSDLVSEARQQVFNDSGSGKRADIVATYLAMGVSRLSDICNSLCQWENTKTQVRHLFTKQAIAMIWDYAEPNVFAGGAGDYSISLSNLLKALIEMPASINNSGDVQQRDATTTLNGYGQLVISTDPPYYDNIGYADLSDFFYVWLRRTLKDIYPDILGTLLTPKVQEMVATPYRFEGSKKKAEDHFETGLTKVFELARQKQLPNFPMTVYYAFKQSEGDENAVASTGWEKMLEGLVQSGFMVTGTWPMRTEMLNRPVASGANALASSIVLVCRARPAEARMATRREFRDALHSELAVALRDLQRGVITPVDLAQSAIGPGMAVYSRYSKVVEANGERLSVRTALSLINAELDSVLAEQEGEYDLLTRFCVTWYEQFGFDERGYGDAENLAHAKNIAISTLDDAGIFVAAKGKARLKRRDELDKSWSPKHATHVTAWGVLQHMVRAHLNGDEKAAAILRYAPEIADVVRDLPYRLYTLCDRKGWTSEAFAYNSLIASWNDITKLVSDSHYTDIQQATLEM